MDRLTHEYYVSHADDVARRYDSVHPYSDSVLRQAFSEGARVLDIGAGSGRDLAQLLELGCEAYGVEPCIELRVAAVQEHPQLAGRLESAALPNLGRPFGGEFDGVLCSAVLMHLTRAEILDAAIAIRSVLKDGGRLLLSVPTHRLGLDEHDRDKDGRLFTLLAPDYLLLLFERIGFVEFGRWSTEDSFGREGFSWCNLLLQVRHPGGTRPIDQIEGIMNRDRKTATYKLALFRALSEVALTSFEQARWYEEGLVGIPVDLVAEKWLYFYWPIFESTTFIPQIRGESPNCRMPVAFRSALCRLIEHYRLRGGITQFTLDYRQGRLSTELLRLLATVLGQIKTTVIKGPVTYSGSALESGPLFEYDRRSQDIRMSGAIWRELSLVGHWIQDAVILRWAELTSEISQRELRPSQVIDVLLAVPIPERDVSDARYAYESAGIAECTWSGARIQRSFDVDHVLPYSLWHSNDLWNLVPASHTVNLGKRDKLPTRRLMLARKGRIVHCWEILRSANGRRFEYEACRLAGLNSFPQNWQEVVFRCVTEAVEFTATQRGCERWEP